MNELTINLQTRSEVPLYEQIYQYMKREIQEGRIASGDKLPSSRSLSRHLEVSRSTVELAYEQLISEGYVEAVPCKGYFAADLEGLYRLDAMPALSEPEATAEEKEWKYDFTPNGVDLNSFPYGVWRRLAKDSLQDDRAQMFRLGDPQGEYGLRRAISHYLYQARGVNARPEQIIVGAGNDYLLMLLSTVIGRDHKVALENPTYKQAYRLFQRLSYDVYDSEFRYKGKPIPALQGYDRWGKVIYIGTFSKSIAPSIRISYLVLPPVLLKEFQEKSSFLSCTVSRVDQLILQRFLEEGHYERHLNKIRTLYKGRHDTLIGCLKELQHHCTISGEHAGVHILLHFSEEVTEEELIQKAAEKGVKVYGLSQYYIDTPGNRPTILLGYANISEEKIKKAVALLEEAWFSK